MIITVLVPTYQRPSDLKRCLDALEKQSRMPDEVIVMRRVEDIGTNQLLENRMAALCLRKVVVGEPGQVAALNLGLKQAQGDIIAITDDDAVPHPHWLEYIEGHFKRDPMIGAVGGRDYVYRGAHLVDEKKRRVGVVQWFGRAIGNHAAGFGNVREVEILKGANMSYRRKAIEGLFFDRRLRGDGAQVCNDMGFSLTVRRRGWRVVYDPAVSVDHYPALRYDVDQRNAFNAYAMTNAIHNETLVLLDYLPPVRRFAFLVWAILVGHRAGPGLVQWFRFWMKRDRQISAKLSAAFKGRLEGYRTWKR